MKKVKGRHKLNIRKLEKLQFIIASLLTVLLAVMLVSLAWYYHQRGLQTATEIHTPYQLYITAGHQEDVTNLSLGEIDVTSGTSKDYVFCVYGTSSVKTIVLQLAHTTNIPFSYTISRAEEMESQPSESYVVYTGEDGKEYYYKKGSVVQGNYLNLDEDTGSVTNQYHDLTYGDGIQDDGYQNVQENAEPLYWQGTDETVQKDGTTDFYNYYILTISWAEGTVKNNKETDIVYLMAGQIN
jgi:hypothetical protein